MKQLQRRPPSPSTGATWTDKLKTQKKTSVKCSQHAGCLHAWSCTNGSLTKRPVVPFIPRTRARRRLQQFGQEVPVADLLGQSMKVAELLAESMRGAWFACGLDEWVGTGRGVDERCKNGDRIDGRWDSGTVEGSNRRDGCLTDPERVGRFMFCHVQTDPIQNELRDPLAVA